MNPYRNTTSPAGAALYVLKSLQSTALFALGALLSAGILQRIVGVGPSSVGGLLFTLALATYFSLGHSVRTLEAVIADSEKIDANQPKVTA